MLVILSSSSSFFLCWPRVDQSVAVDDVDVDGNCIVYAHSFSICFEDSDMQRASAST